MEIALENIRNDTLQRNEYLMKMLDRGIDQMESGMELPLDEAFQKIRKLRNQKRN